MSSSKIYYIMKMMNEQIENHIPSIMDRIIKFETREHVILCKSYLYISLYTKLKRCGFQHGDKSLVMNIKKHVKNKTHNQKKETKKIVFSSPH